MAELQTLAATKRTETGKGPNRRLRAKGSIPAVFYNGKGENLALKVPDMPFRKAYAKCGTTQVFNLEIEGHETIPSLIWKTVNHPFKNQVLHVDFFGVDLKKKLRVTVPVEFTGEPVGVKLGGGQLATYRDHLEVLALPLNIPESIVIDVTDLEMNHNLMIADVTPPEGVEMIFDDNFAVVGVTAISEAEEAGGEEALEGEASGGEAAETE